ncbi:MAG: molybdopterin oxidoreductase family protein [Lachnospirales bacterium]
MKVVQSTCNYCSLDCNLDFHVENDTIVKVVPREGYPVNAGFSCIKGINLDKQQTVIKNNQLPKVRQADGSFKDLSWDEAFKHTAGKIKEIQEKYGDEAFAGISTGQLTMEEFAIAGHVIRNELKANLDGNTRLCMATAVVSYVQSFGFDAPGYTLNDLELSDTIIFIGANPVVAHPIIWDRVQKNSMPNKKVIVIDPRKSETAKNADYFYQVNTKADINLFYTLANILIGQGHVDENFVQNHTNKYEEFVEFVKDYSVDKVEETTGLKPEEVQELADLIAKGKNVSFWWTMGINQSYVGVRTAQSIINVALLTGNIGRPGTGPNSLTGQCNAMGSRAFSNTTAFYGGGTYDKDVRRTKVAGILGVDEDYLPSKPTFPYNKIIEEINAGNIKGLWVLCTNPRHSWTNNETFQQAVDKLELFIVQDIYTTTESAEIADVIFPVVPGIKKEGTYINTERRLSPMRICIDRKENEKSDYEVIYGMGEALGMGDKLKGWETPEDAFELMKKCSEGMPLDITGVEWKALENSNGIQWPFRKGEVLTDDERRLFEDGNFYTPNKKANFMFEAPPENPMPLNNEFPVLLNTGRGTVGQWHTQTRTREIGFVEDVAPKPAHIFINSKYASDNNIKDLSKVLVNSMNGQSAEFVALLSEDVRYNEIYAPIHYIECNKLTPSVYDPFSKEPSYKSTPVNIQLIRG